MKTLVLLLVAASSSVAIAAEPLTLHLHHRRETSPGSGQYEPTVETAEWRPEQTAIIICDMWDQHWCQGATARVAEMAPVMNEVIKAARDKGVLIIHCPSSCLEFYKDAPQRALAMNAPPVDVEIPLEDWCHLDEQLEGPLPIDDSDGGCNCDPECPGGSPWKRQIAAIEIGPDDALTDSAEAYYLMRSRGITSAIVMGVHTNMCVLGRPFGIRQLVKQGMNVAVMRDMTDTMYDSKSAPFVSHFAGTDLVIEHIERSWCPSVTSSDFTGRDEFRFAEDARPRVAVSSTLR